MLALRERTESYDRYNLMHRFCTALKGLHKSFFCDSNWGPNLMTFSVKCETRELSDTNPKWEALTSVLAPLLPSFNDCYTRIALLFNMSCHSYDLSPSNVSLDVYSSASDSIWLSLTLVYLFSVFCRLKLYPN